MNFGRGGDMCHALFEWLRCHVILITVTLVCLKVKQLPLKVGIVILHIQYLNKTKERKKRATTQQKTRANMGIQGWSQDSRKHRRWRTLQ